MISAVEEDGCDGRCGVWTCKRNEKGRLGGDLQQPGNIKVGKAREKGRKKGNQWKSRK